MIEALGKFEKSVIGFITLSAFVIAIAVLSFVSAVTKRDLAFVYFSIGFLGAALFLALIYRTQISMELKSKITGSPFGEEQEQYIVSWRQERVYKIWGREIPPWLMPLAILLALICMIAMTYELQAMLKVVTPAPSELHYIGGFLLFYGPLFLMLLLSYRTSGLFDRMWDENPLPHKMPFHLLMARPEINALKSAEARLLGILAVMAALAAVFVATLTLVQKFALWA